MNSYVCGFNILVVITQIHHEASVPWSEWGRESIKTFHCTVVTVHVHRHSDGSGYWRAGQLITASVDNKPSHVFSSGDDLQVAVRCIAHAPSLAYRPCWWRRDWALVPPSGSYLQPFSILSGLWGERPHVKTAAAVDTSRCLDNVNVTCICSHKMVVWLLLILSTILSKDNTSAIFLFWLG